MLLAYFLNPMDQPHSKSDALAEKSFVQRGYENPIIVAHSKERGNATKT
jgi:hypothetical protein